MTASLGSSYPSWDAMKVRRLAMLLSSLSEHPSGSVELEQYTTEGDLAVRWLSDIVAFGDLAEGCTVADLGAGNGVLGLGALAMGAGRALLVEADQTACDVAMLNAELMGFADSVELIQGTLGSDPVDLSSVVRQSSKYFSDLHPDLLSSEHPPAVFGPFRLWPNLELRVHCKRFGDLFHRALRHWHQMEGYSLSSEPNGDSRARGCLGTRGVR